MITQRFAFLYYFTGASACEFDLAYHMLLKEVVIIASMKIKFTRT